MRLRFPILRWVLPTPEWHHWHHATDAEAHDHNFGLPVVDRLFGTAYLPRGIARRASASPTPFRETAISPSCATPSPAPGPDTMLVGGT